MSYSKYTHITTLYKYSILLLILLLCLSSCIKDDFPNCNTTLFLQIKAVDATGVDITSSGEAGAAEVYIFDRNQRFIEQISVTSEDIKNKVPLKIFHKGTSNFTVVVWSNLNGNQQVDSLTIGTSIDQAFVQLKRSAEGYALNPDDLFQGILNIKNNSNASSDITIEDSITIQRKTALLNIMVKGLEFQNPNNYYFIIKGASKDTYNFKGELVGDSIRYKQNGEFNTSGTQFISSPFSLYPLPEGGRLTILIYNGENLIATAETNNKDGSNIVPIVGVTTNVLIDLRASLNVNIVVTDWEDIYHWFEW